MGHPSTTAATAATAAAPAPAGRRRMPQREGFGGLLRWQLVMVVVMVMVLAGQGRWGAEAFTSCRPPPPQLQLLPLRGALRPLHAAQPAATAVATTTLTRRRFALSLPWGARRRWQVRPFPRPLSAASDGGPADVGNDPSGAGVVPKPYPPIEPTKGPNPKAIAALVGGELLLGLLAFPIGYAFKINPLASIKHAFAATATAAVGGLGPAVLNALGFSLLLTLPALVLHKVSGDVIEDMLRESLTQIFGSPETTRRRPLLMLAISFLLSLSAGLGEELLFRGALQPLVASLARSDAVGVGLSSLLFAVLHAATPRYLLLAFVLSVYLGWIQLSTANLFIPICVHTVFDVVGFALSLFDTGKGKKGKAAS